jgi:predicted dehydrogenase
MLGALDSLGKSFPVVMKMQIQPGRKVQVGFIGAGSVAQVHQAALEKCGSAHVAAVYDIDPDRANAFAPTTATRVCRTADELVRLPELDAVFVLTPLQSHFEDVMRSLKARKHTFVEKPVSLIRKEVEEMRDVAERHSLLCVPAHNYIHNSELKKARRLIQDGKLGDIYGIWVFFMLALPRETCVRLPGVLREVMIHHFYSLLFLMGKPVKVFATAGDPRRLGRHKEDQASVVCNMPNGAIATLFGSFCADDLTADPWTVIYKVIGSEGSFSHSWSNTRLRHRPQPIWNLPAYWDTFLEEDRYFIEQCLLGGKKPLSTLEDVLTCLDILNAAEESIESRTG